jgi:hypothetical protein
MLSLLVGLIILGSAGFLALTQAARASIPSALSEDRGSAGQGEGAVTATPIPSAPCPPGTPTRVPTPAFTPGPGCSAIPAAGDLDAAITTSSGAYTEVLFTHHSTTCSYPIGLAIYRRFDPNIDHQQLYDYALAVIPPNSSLVLRVNNPPCAFQADAFYGEILYSFAGGVRYGSRLLDDTFGHGHNWCTQSCATPTATLPGPVPSSTATLPPPPPSNTPPPGPTNTNTALPPTGTRTSTPGPTNTNTALPPTGTRTSTPGPTNTNTALPPTSTRTSTPGPTNTNTALPPTSTRTSTPGPTNTNTALPPTSTRTNTPTNTPTPGCLVLTGSITTTDPTFQRPNTFSQGGSCSTSSTGAGVHYDVYEVNMASAATVQASLCAAGGGSANFDTFIAIYQAPGGAQQPGFIPNACTIAEAANDDFCGSASQVQANVVAGYFYVVVTQYSTNTSLCTGGLCYGDYSLSVQGLAGCPLPTATPTNTATVTRTVTMTPTGGVPTATATRTATITPCPFQPLGTFTGSITTNDPTFQRPNAFTQGGSCSTSSTGAGVHYDVYELTTASTATIQASLCAAGGGSANFDTFLAIYQAPGGAQQPGFIPNGCTIAQAANDDFCGSASQIQANVVAGYYYVVVTQYSTSSNSCTGGLCYGDYTLALSQSSCTPVPTFTPGTVPTATPTPAVCIPNQTFTGAITANDPSHTNFVNFYPTPSTCGPTPACPGVITDSSSYHYDTYTFVNMTGSAQCITVTVNAGGCGAGSTGLAAYAYLGTFNPASLCTNYAGGANGQISGTSSFQLTVPAGSTFTVEVEEYVAGAFCSSYTVTVGSCAAAQPPAPPRPFTDVPVGSTFYPYVTCLITKDIVSGYPDGTFRPNNNVTRGQAAKIVANAGGYNDRIPVARQTFRDVPNTQPFWLYIERAAAHGILAGYPDGTFHPNNNVTRGQLAKIAAKAAGYSEPVTTQTFRDVPVGNPFYLYIERMAQRHLISGYPDGTFRPTANLTRGQAAKIVSNTLLPDCVATGIDKP